jgi:hypothetical protein
MTTDNPVSVIPQRKFPKLNPFADHHPIFDSMRGNRELASNQIDESDFAQDQLTTQ